jgi:hypothetical protein
MTAYVIAALRKIEVQAQERFATSWALHPPRAGTGTGRDNEQHGRHGC